METSLDEAATYEPDAQATLTGPPGAGRHAPPPPGLLMGRVDDVHPHRIVGWALDIDAPNRPVVLRVLADGVAFARIVANLYRSDLKAAGFASGLHGFELAVQPGLLTAALTTIRVQRDADGLDLPDSPWTLPARHAETGRGQRRESGRGIKRKVG